MEGLPATCEIVDYQVDSASTNYPVLQVNAGVLIPTVQIVQLKHIHTPSTAKAFNIPVHERSLPWGLLHSVTVHEGTYREAVDAHVATCATRQPFTIQINKSTGTRQSRPRFIVPCVHDAAAQPENIASVVNWPMTCDQDAIHDDIKRVFQLTDHMMRFRAIAAADISSITLCFTSPPPQHFYIKFWGFNVLPHDSDSPESNTLTFVKQTLASGMMVRRLLFHPITPAMRRANASGRGADDVSVSMGTEIGGEEITGAGICAGDVSSSL
jgi:hypothetical protein